MKLLKEECLRAFRILVCRNETGEGIEALYPYFKYEFDCLLTLIHAHFENPPLKFEELKIAEPIWENEKLGWIFIKYIIKPSRELCCVDVDGKIWTLKYEPNRFYRKQVKE